MIFFPSRVAKHFNHYFTCNSWAYQTILREGSWRLETTLHVVASEIRIAREVFFTSFFQNEKELVRLHGLQYTYVIAKCFINFQHQIRSNFCIWIIVRHLIHLCLNRNSVLPTQGIKSVHLHRKQKLQQTLTINRDLTQKLTALDPPNMSAGKHEPDPENVMPLRERM